MKSIRFLIAGIFACVALPGIAQVDELQKSLKPADTDTLLGWKKGIVSSVNLAQTALINWSAGGQNSFAINGLFSAFAIHKTATSQWDNTLDLGYGILRQGANADFIKTDDRFDFVSKYGVKAFGDFNYAALLNFKTQFTPGYDFAADTALISDFLSPGYLLGALGLNYAPNVYFNAFVAPVTGRLTVVNNDVLSAAGAYGVAPGEKTRGEFGGYVRVVYSRSDFTAELLRNVAFTSKLDLFSNYLDNPQELVVNWENQLALKVNRYIGVSINTHIFYDPNIRINGEEAKVQFKEILGVGFFLKI